MKKEIRSLLKELKTTLFQVYRDNLGGLYLFGSYATHQEQSESDVDVAIVLKDFQDYWEEIERTGQVISDLSLKYDVSISPIRVRENDWIEEDSPFLKNVRKECVLL